MKINYPIEASISARVFRAKKKPYLIPQRIWKYIVRKRLPGTGHWQDLGVLFEN